MKVITNVICTKNQILIVRHGETNENRQGIIQGQLDTDLNEIGIAQSKLVAKALADTSITHAFCSPLKRATKTFDEILRLHEGLECKYHHEIKEYHCGRLQGLTKKAALAVAQKEGITYQQFRSMGGAEDPASVYGRLDHFWKSEILPLRKTDSTVLIVSHGGIISTLRLYLKGLNYRIHDSLLKNGELRDYEVRNCSITEIVLGPKGPGEFIRMGDWDHIMEAFTELYNEKLENSTGSA